jgi:hypothetical protein
MLVPFFDRAWLTGSSLPARLLGVVLPYSLVMGWQPVAAVLLVRVWVEPDETLDAGSRPALRRYMAVATLGSLGLLTAASVVKLAAKVHPIDLTAPARARNLGNLALSTALDHAGEIWLVAESDSATAVPAPENASEASWPR